MYLAFNSLVRKCHYQYTYSLQSAVTKDIKSLSYRPPNSLIAYLYLNIPILPSCIFRDYTVRTRLIILLCLVTIESRRTYYALNEVRGYVLHFKF